MDKIQKTEWNNVNATIQVVVQGSANEVPYTVSIDPWSLADSKVKLAKKQKPKVMTMTYEEWCFLESMRFSDSWVEFNTTNRTKVCALFCAAGEDDEWEEGEGGGE